MRRFDVSYTQRREGEQINFPFSQVEATLDSVTDVYYQKFGLRTVRATQTQLLLNERPLYLMGFGKHEDADIRGKGLDLALIVKDFNLIRWIGANSFRTSHYPYSEELMDQADAQGIAVIDESPAVALGLEHCTGPGQPKGPSPARPAGRARAGQTEPRHNLYYCGVGGYLAGFGAASAKWNARESSHPHRFEICSSTSSESRDWHSIDCNNCSICQVG
ncbi:hypothetical protein HPB47_019877 [Ixodes persulcatus]|uniref:Uncharacterized protein n=1 Tax=Ixodes persulcatus TaxID=34615 RepID=A0AC60QH09_IXOPE|nr:hypothetical protein HPB47_019877 [Ixodes persulcatus]